MKQRGFTTIELLVVLVVLCTGAWLFFSQKASIDASARDSERKVAINAMYYSLEEDFYEKNGFYPSTIDSKILRSIDPALFTDPRGHKPGEGAAEYHYAPIDCSLEGRCKAYRLYADMEREAEYSKDSRQK
ncbi:hypothetical protein CR970_04395 [Candidatus Saccharibacteria bacterium]|nr:MAG: hypothetical protein CR970_04395 [Candidatus Saccharibacteria bacterium]